MHESRQDTIAEPRVEWTDHVARWLRTHTVRGHAYSTIMGHAYALCARRLVPFLFAVFVAVPVGLLLLPLFLPKFFRNRRRRRQYGVRLESEQITRIPGETSPPS